MTTNKVNFTERHVHGQWAKYLPAISTFYTKHLGRELVVEEFIPKARIPKKFELGIQGLDFLKAPEDCYFNYKFALYSAGHAVRDLTKCEIKEPMIHRRDRENTILIGDSGGFQIATGVIKVDWATVQTPAGDPLREEILRFLEHTADWSMTLDVPAFAALPPLSEKTGLTTFEECIDVTEYNLKYFMKHRVPGATKFLNVLSGSDNENSKTWYDRVIPYSMPEAVEAMGYSVDRTLEGYAFAGYNMKNMRTVLERILDLRNDNMLAGKDWIHFLGIGRLDWACYLTSVERLLKKYDNPNINISFDAASPFVAAGGYALSYNYNYFKPDQLTYAMGRGIDDRALKGSEIAMPFQGPIMERLTAGDMCVMGHGDLNKQGKESKTSWDSTTYALIMAHNVYNHIQAIQEINRLADIEYATREVDYRDWYQTRDKKKNLSDFVPNSILFFNNFVEVLLDPATPDPYKMLFENQAFLDFVSFGDKKSVTTFGTLFGGEDDINDEHIPRVEDLAASDDEHLVDE
jgi:hypothetical protein